MADEEDSVSIEVRFSRLTRKIVENQTTVLDEKSRSLQTQRCDSDSGFNSDVSTGNGEIISKHSSLAGSNLETLIESCSKESYRTFNDPDRNSNSSLGNSDNNGERQSNADSVETSEQKFSFKTLTKEQKIILASTSFTNLLSFLSLSILAPFFPEEANDKNVNDTISGWIFGSFALVQFLTSPLFGKLLPYLGSRFMFLSGLFVCGGCTFIFGFLDLIDTTESILTFVSLCFIVRIFLAFGCTSLNNAGFVMLLKAFPNDIATVFGIGEVFTGIGMVTGPALGGFLYAAGGFITPFAVIGGLCFVTLPLIWYAVPPQDDSISEKSDLSVLRLLFHPKSMVNSLAVIVAAAIWAILDPTLEPHLRVYGLSSEMVGILFLVMAAFYSVASPLWGWFADKTADNRTLLIPAFIVAAIGLLLLGPSPVLGFDLSFNEIWLTIVSLIILGVACALCVIPTYDIYLDVLQEIEYPDDTRTYGMVSGLWVSMYALGDFAGPSLGGFLFEEVGFEWMASYTAGLCVFTSVVVALSWLTDKKCRCCKGTAKPVIESSERTPLLNNSVENISESLHSYPPIENEESSNA